MLVGKNVMINELLELFKVSAYPEEGVSRTIFLVAEDAQKEVVRRYSVTACSQCLFP